ncbi:MAG: DNA-binding LytR/AlgR family response regulator [Cyclobacteriaceae bacterium]|jgi:DNA-binding LytR/AlgR family response regulator
MRVLIIEDEMIAAKRLQEMILTVDKSFEIVEILDSISTSVSWLSSNMAPDLIFMDIQLADGLSFEIFEKIDTESPIIFTTAYDQYAIKAFKLNSLDYLLKPIVTSDLKTAIDKFKKDVSKQSLNLVVTKQLIEALSLESSKKYKEQFVVKTGDHLKTVQVSEIKFIYSQDKTTYAHSKDERKYILDYTLDQIEELIDSNYFFRINRKYIINQSQIVDIIVFSNSRLKLQMKDGKGQEDLIVARDRVSDFKKWLDR